MVISYSESTGDERIDWFWWFIQLGKFARTVYLAHGAFVLAEFGLWAGLAQEAAAPSAALRGWFFTSCCTQGIIWKLMGYLKSQQTQSWFNSWCFTVAEIIPKLFCCPCVWNREWCHPLMQNPPCCPPSSALFQPSGDDLGLFMENW